MGANWKIKSIMPANPGAFSAIYTNAHPRNEVSSWRSKILPVAGFAVIESTDPERVGEEQIRAIVPGLVSQGMRLAGVNDTWEDEDGDADEHEQNFHDSYHDEFLMVVAADDAEQELERIIRIRTEVRADRLRPARMSEL